MIVNKISNSIPRNLRWTYNSLFLLDHILGQERVNFFFSGTKKKYQKKLESSLANTGRSQQKVAVPTLENLSPVEFFEEYYLKGIPVIFKGAAKSSLACEQWNFSFFKEKYGQDEAIIVNHPAYGDNQESFEVTTLEKLIDSIDQDSLKYARFHPLLDRHPELQDYLDKDWFDDYMCEKSEKGFVFHTLFMSGGGTNTPVHNARQSNLFLQIEGQKRWFLWPADYAYLFRPEANRMAAKHCDFNPFQPDLEKYPGYQYLDYYEATIEPGDILYVPPYMWHYVENLSPSIGVGTRWTSFINSLRNDKLLACMEFINTNPSILKVIKMSIEAGEFDFNRTLLHTRGHKLPKKPSESLPTKL